MTLRLLSLALLCVTTLAPAAEVLLKDDFSDAKLPQRRAARGEWKFADGTATCTQDDALFKKNKDHGPIIFYNLPVQDARVRFSFKASGVKMMVFTANGEDGHIFRFGMSEKATPIRAFPVEGGEHKSIGLKNEPPMLKEGEWIPVEVDLRGSKATVKIGEFAQTYEHPSLARPKTNISIGFSFGTLSVKDVTVEK